MKASVQYNDLVGTAAADVTDFYNSLLQNYLEKEFLSYDSKRYQCVGCNIWVSGQLQTPSGNIKFICKDSVENKYVYFVPVKEMSLEEIFSLFKRFDVVIGNYVEEITIANDDYLDLK